MRPAQVALRRSLPPSHHVALLEDSTKNKEVVVLPRRLKIAFPRVQPSLLLILLSCLSGCAAMVQDVHLYYQQMAVNYKEAEEKAKLDAVSLERESASLLQGGELTNTTELRESLPRSRTGRSIASASKSGSRKLLTRRQNPLTTKRTQTRQKRRSRKFSRGLINKEILANRPIRLLPGGIPPIIRLSSWRAR